MRALLVIDMVVDFIRAAGALYCGDQAAAMVPFVRAKVEEFQRAGEPVIFICDAHASDDLEFRMFPRHSVKGSPGSRVIAELPVGPGDTIVEKTRYSSFYNSELDQVLDRRRPDEVHVVGVCTSICIMDTVGDLRNRDYPVVVYSQGVADFDPEAHAFSLKRMEKIYGAKVV